MLEISKLNQGRDKGKILVRSILNPLIGSTPKTFLANALMNYQESNTPANLIMNA